MTEAHKPPKAPKPKAPQPDQPESTATAAKAASPKKEKAPALEDKPFTDFVQQDLLPGIQAGLASQGVTDLDVKFAKTPVSISGVTGIPDCWQIIGQWQQGHRQFNLYFFDENIQGQRGFSCTSHGIQTSSIESFLIDERKITLDLLVFGLLQRLNAQKWLQPN
jgi:hypothetical protein